MKKATIIILTVLFLATAGCTKAIANAIDEEITQPIETAKLKNTPEPLPDSILVIGIVSEINDNMVTLTQVKELGAENTVVLKINDETKWDAQKEKLQLGVTMNAEISTMMTRSYPPQSNAISIISLKNIVYGEVFEVNDNAITIKSTNFYNHQEVIVLLTDETKWNIDVDVIEEGHMIELILSNIMTASMPPQVVAVEVIAVK